MCGWILPSVRGKQKKKKFLHETALNKSLWIILHNPAITSVTDTHCEFYRPIYLPSILEKTLGVGISWHLTIRFWFRGQRFDSKPNVDIFGVYFMHDLK